MPFVIILIAAFLGVGLWLLCSAKLFHDRSFSGRRSISRFRKWQGGEKDVWESGLLQKLTAFCTRFVYPDRDSEEKLARQLERAGMQLTPKEFTARKYVIAAATAIGVLFCILVKFWFGIILFGLCAALLLMKQRESLTSRLKERDSAIAAEMPRFVRTLCRNLRTNRDIYAVLLSYRKVAGPVLGEELDILLAHMRTGGTVSALQQFQKRLGTEEAFRLCSALQEIDRGIDQTATLEYLADDMARQAKYEVQKTLSVRPARMRRTYLPAVGVCVAMIFYVLIVFVTSQLNNLF